MSPSEKKMDLKRINYIVGTVVFLISAVTYLTTMQPNVSFWDCGEFIASAYTQSVPHPPGGPLWNLVGKVATMFPFGDNPAVRMNAVASVSSAFTVFFLYLVIVIVIKNWRGFPKNTWDAVMIFGSAAIGALSYAFSESFWFNSIESEVYALGTMLIGLCVWLLMYWWEKADEKGNEKYLLFVAYVAGLSLGIHLLVVQVILIGGLLFAFRKNEEIESSFVTKFFVFLFFYFLFTFYLYAGGMSKVLLGLKVIIVLGGVLYYIYKKNPGNFSFALTLILTGGFFFLVYPGIVINYPTLLSSEGLVRIFGILIIPGLIFGVYWAYKNKKLIFASVFIGIFLVFLGYSIYTSVILRARVDNLPINENEPDDIETLVSYLSREQYGDAPFWPRRYSQEPMHRRTWANYTGDMDFMWRYQINHMFNRYLGWQYIGREGYDQDLGVDWSKLYGIPFLIGLFGLFYHFRKDWKLGITFLIMFLMMGVITELFQRQQDPQPRERDYFYVGAFFVYSLWIGLGVMGILEVIKEYIKNQQALKFAGITTLLIAFIFVPANMYRVNHFYEDRSNNYVPFDYAYNILQSTAKDGIIFTNGDNDTFPLWYLQAIGYRQDVRVVNLSLLNTNWYIKEMKNEMPYGALRISINMTDAQIDKLQPTQWSEYKVVSVPVPSEAYPDSIRATGNTPDKLSWKMPATFTSGNIKGVKVQDLLIYEIVKSNNWQRPVYFSATVTDDNFIGLDEYLVTEGMSKRLVPFKGDPSEQFRVNHELTWKNFLETPAQHSKTPQAGYFFRGLNDSGIFFDQVHENLVQNYRTQYLILAYSFLNLDTNKVNAVLDKMETNLPRTVVPMDYRILHDISMLYNKINNRAKFTELSYEVEKQALQELNKNPNDVSSFWNPYRLLMEIYEARGEYAKAIDILNKMDRLSPGNPEIKMKIEMLRAKMLGR